MLCNGGSNGKSPFYRCVKLKRMENNELQTRCESTTGKTQQEAS